MHVVGACSNELGQSRRGTVAEVELVHGAARSLELEALEHRTSGHEDDVRAALGEDQHAVRFPQVHERGFAGRHSEPVQRRLRVAGERDVPPSVAVGDARAGVTQHGIVPLDLLEDVQRLGRVDVTPGGPAEDSTLVGEGQVRYEPFDLASSFARETGVRTGTLRTVGDQ